MTPLGAVFAALERHHADCEKADCHPYYPMSEEEQGRTGPGYVGLPGVPAGETGRMWRTSMMGGELQDFEIGLTPEQKAARHRRMGRKGRSGRRRAKENA